MNRQMGGYHLAGPAKCCMATLLIMNFLGCSTTTKEDTLAIDKVTQLTVPYLWLKDIDREYDLATKQFVDYRFNLPEAKQEVASLDENTLLLSRPRGEGSVTRLPAHRLAAGTRYPFCGI